MKILGLHHITLVASNAQQTVDFYVKVLGLRLVKQTVNFDDPGAYHLYFGDAVGTPCSAITFFEWPRAPKGKAGIGGTHHFALRVPNQNALLKWKRRLTDLNIRVDGPFARNYFTSIYFRDPDGTVIEIATDGPGWTIDEAEDALGQEFRAPPAEMQAANRDSDAIKKMMWQEPVPVITSDMALAFGMHHITAISSDIQRTNEFLTDVLGLQRVKMTDNFDDPGSAHWYWGVDNGKPGSIITYFERDAAKTRRAIVGHGMTHHYAFAVKDEDEQTKWRARLAQAGLRASPIMDRDYFRSVYTNDPDGHIVELATLDPGFDVDEPVAQLGTQLQLPHWLEQHRATIENALTPLDVPEWKEPEPAE